MARDRVKLGLELRCPGGGVEQLGGISSMSIHHTVFKGSALLKPDASGFNNEELETWLRIPHPLDVHTVLEDRLTWHQRSIPLTL